jgi:hypothetical protein
MTRHVCPGRPAWHALLGWAVLLLLAPPPLGADPLPALTSTGAVLFGRVVDAATRAPIPGAEIVGSGQATAVTDEWGGFEWPLGGRVPLALQVQAPGYLPRTVEIREPKLSERLVVALERAPGYAEQLVVTGPPPAPPEPVQEVAAQTVADTPGAFEDGMQALKSLPGVISRDDWSGRLYVRGGRPDQNGIYLDGIPVYDPYRLFGLTSLFNPETLESISLYPGGFDVRYGDRLSAVIAGESRVGTIDRSFAGSANVSLTNANLRAEGRLGLGFPSSWLVSFRRSYFDLVATDEDIPSFTDLQARILLEPSPRHRLTLTLVGAQEETDLVADDQEFDGLPDNHVEAGDTQTNLVLGLQGQHLFSDRLRLRYVASRTSDSQTSDVFYREGETGFETRADQDLEAATTSLRTWVESTLGRHTLELGGEAARSENTVGFHIDTDDPGVDIPDSVKSYDDRQDYSRFGGFAQDTIDLGRDLELKAGVRWDRSELSGMSTTSPRASLVWRPGAAWELRGAWGHYYQYPSFEALQGDGYFLDLRGIKDARLRPEHAEHFVAGVAYTGARGWKLSLDLYDKPLEDILASGKEEETILVLDAHDQAFPYVRERRTFLPENSRHGYARGAQVVLTLLEGTSRPYYGMLAYSYGEARTRDDEGWQWEDHDQRHSVLLTGGYRFSRHFELSGTWHFATGFPTTPVRNIIRVVEDVNGDGVYDPAAGDTFTYQRDEDHATINSERLPAYHRLDLRLEYTPAPGRLTWSYYLDIINAYARDNVEGYSYNADYTRKEPSEGLPFLPSVGVRVRF